MTLERGRYYFGSAGDMQALPMTSRSNPDIAPVRYGTAGRALGGQPTIVSYGYRRTWPLAWPDLRYDSADVRTLMRVEAVYRGLLQRRAYLIDSRATNAFPPDVASAGGEEGTDNFVVSSGSLQRVNAPAVHADLWGLCDGYLDWTGLATGAGRTLLTTKHVPVLAGSALLFSAYLNTDGSGSVQQRFDFYDEYRVFLSSTTSATIVLTTTPTRRTYSLVSGSVPAGAASFTAGIVTTATTTDVTVAGLQLEYDAVGGATPAAWCIGAASAEVVVGEFHASYPDAAQRSISAEFWEV